jgi:hypothetical protein
MLSLNLNLSNPWSDRFHTVKTWFGHIPFRNMYWEAQVYRSPEILNLMLNIYTCRDHARFELAVGVLGFGAQVSLYDNRHWDSVHEDWATEPVTVTEQRWILDVLPDPENPEECMIQFPEDLLSAAGWAPGDDLVWTDMGDGSWQISKKDVNKNTP